MAGEHHTAHGRDQRVPGKLRHTSLPDLGNKQAGLLLGIGPAKRTKPARRQNRQLIVIEPLDLEGGNSHTYVDPRAGRITLTEWVNQWYPALDLEPTTLSNYRYQIEVHILPTFGNRALASITAEEVSAWERQIAASGYSRRTARDARSTLATVLGDAIPRYIQANPAQRRRGKGRKGQRRIQRIEQAGKHGRRRQRRCWSLSDAPRCPATTQTSW